MIRPDDLMKWPRRLLRGLRITAPGELLVRINIAVALAMMIAEGIQGINSLQVLKSRQDDNIVWTAANLEIERLRFKLAMNETLAPDVALPQAITKMKTAFDIYYSRVRIVEAYTPQIAPELPREYQAVEYLHDLMDETEDIAGAIDSGHITTTDQRRSLLQYMSSNDGKAYMIAQAILQLTVTESADQRLRALDRVTWTLVFAIGASLLILLNALFHERLLRIAKREETRARATSALLERTFQASLDALVLCSMDGTIRRINLAAEEIFGMPETLAEGRSIVSFAARSNLEDVDRLARAFAKHRDLRLRRRLYRHDGTIFVAYIHGSVELDDDGEPFLLMAIRDQTALMQKRSADRKERLSRRLDADRRETLFAGLIHTLRTPLHTALAALETVEDVDLGSDATQHLETARNAIRISVGQTEGAIAEALHTHVQVPSATMLQPLAMARAVLMASAMADAPRMELLGTSQLVVTADPHLFATALMRLLDWAVSCADGQAEARIRVAMSDRSARSIRITVSVEGLTPADLIDATASQSDDALDQAFEALSALGSRARMHVTPGNAPAISFEIAAGHPLRPRIVPDAPQKVLVVDDSVEAATLITKTLQGFGHQVSCCNSGEAAVRLAGQERFDTIFLDVSMPGLDGFDALGLMRKEGASQKAKIVFLTANLLPEEWPRAMALGVDGILTKPASSQDLQRYLTCSLPAQPAASTVDPIATLGVIADVVGEDLAVRMVDGLAGELAAVRAAEAEGAPLKQIANLAHQVAGSAAVLGVDSLHKAAAAYENALRRADVPISTAAQVEELAVARRGFTAEAAGMDQLVVEAEKRMPGRSRA